MLEQKKENQKAALYAFGGLEEKELNTLYNLAKIKTLQKDEALFLEGDTDQTVYVVLGGGDKDRERPVRASRNNVHCA